MLENELAKNKSKIMGIRLKVDEFEKAKECAGKDNRSVSAYIRNVLVNHLKEIEP